MEQSIGIHKHGGLKVMVVAQEHTIDEVIQAFECALRGASFVFNGHLELVEDD
jgi:hypothetical protein